MPPTPPPTPMSSPAVPSSVRPDAARLTHLQRLEAESIHIMREVVANAENPVMLYSVGKDSAMHAASGEEGVLPGTAAVSAVACRYDVEVPRHV